MSLNIYEINPNQCKGRYIYSMAKMNLYLYFPHLWTEFGEIWYKPSARSAVEHWWVPWKSAKRIMYFHNGHK